MIKLALRIQDSYKVERHNWGFDMVLEEELSQATNRVSQKLIKKIYYYLIEKLFLNAVATTILLYPASLFFDLAYSVF